MIAKDLAYIKIIQYVHKKGKAGFVGKDGFYAVFDMIPKKNGQYDNRGTWPFSPRSLSRYVEELCEEGILNCEIENGEKIYSLNNQKYVFNLNFSEEEIKEIINILVAKKDMNLLEKIKPFLNEYNSDEEYYVDKGSIEKMLNCIDIKAAEPQLKPDEKVREKLEVALAESRNAEILYQGKTYSVFPLSIVRSISKNREYLFCLRRKRIENPFIISKINEVRLGEAIDIDKSPYLENIRKRWDVEGDSEVEVEILFTDELEVINKLSKDLRYRQNHSLERTKGGYLYKDVIVGINDFKNWLREYSGSSIVIKPKTLREEILRNAKKKLERYGVMKDVL